MYSPILDSNATCIQTGTMVLREWLSSRNGGILTAVTAFLVLTYVNLSIHQQYREHVLNQVRCQVHPFMIS